VITGFRSWSDGLMYSVVVAGERRRQAEVDGAALREGEPARAG